MNDKDCNRLIVQLDSITKYIDIDSNIEKGRKCFLILDEVESVLGHFSSTTMRGKLAQVSSTLYKLIKHS